jgi:hypothetical protein
MQNGPEVFRPFQGPSGQQLQPKRAALHDGAGNLWRQGVHEVEESSSGTIRAAQRDYSHHASEVRAAVLLASFDVATEEGKRARARLLSYLCRPASAWLDTLLLTRDLELRSGEFLTGLCHRLGTTVLPPNKFSVQCGCSATLRGMDMDHSMQCPALTETTLRHDILKKILRRVVHWAGIPSPLEPALCRLPGLEQGAGLSREGHTVRVGALGGALRQVITNISVVPPLSINTLSAAAAEAGAAASCRDQQKQNA